MLESTIGEFKKMLRADNTDRIHLDRITANLHTQGYEIDLEYLKSWFPEDNLKKILFILHSICTLLDLTVMFPIDINML